MAGCTFVLEGEADCEVLSGLEFVDDACEIDPELNPLHDYIVSYGYMGVYSGY